MKCDLRILRWALLLVLILVLVQGTLAGIVLSAQERENNKSLYSIDTCVDESLWPIVIAHRGASGYRPEHTVAAYRLAIEQGADFIEVDLVASKDGVLIARHENVLARVQLDAHDRVVVDVAGNPIVLQETTDVSELKEFGNRLSVKYIDGMPIGGWFSEDFTLAEIKKLRVRERIPKVRPQNTDFNDMFEIPTLADIIALVKKIERTSGTKSGLYLEIKHPTYFAKEGRFWNEHKQNLGEAINISLGKTLIESLIQEGFMDPARIYIQSFEFESLIELGKIMPLYGMEIPLIQLYGNIGDISISSMNNFSRPYDMTHNATRTSELRTIYGRLVDLVKHGITPNTRYGDLVSPEVLKLIANTYANGIGVWKNSILARRILQRPMDRNGDGSAEIISQLSGEVHPLLFTALTNGLQVHPYTLRAEERYLTLHPNGLPQSITGEVMQWMNLGVHGFFIDQPDEGRKARSLFLEINCH